MPQTLPSAVNQDLEYEDYYETTLSQPLATDDTDVYVETMPQSVVGFLVIDPAGSQPETIFFNETGANYVRCPSSDDGEGRGVFNTTPQPWESGTTIGMYSIAAYFEAIVTGVAMRDGFIEARHFSSETNPNNWVGVGQSLVYGASNTQREFTYVGSGDLTSTLSVGMKLQLPRVTDVGYQCTDLESGSSQYAAKTSPTGLSFTDDFTCEAWVKLESYATGGIVARRNSSTEGWSLSVASDGRVSIASLRIASNNRTITSTQALPLNKWVHVAATMDNSGNTHTMYFDGVAVTTTNTTNGTITALVQGTTALVVGALMSDGTSPFDGKISDVRVWATIRTANQIKDNMHKRLVGDETNLVSYFKLSGNFNDATSNANNLTGSGSAVATAADAPFAATEYAFITSLVYAAGSTTITIFTGQNLAPAENLSNIAYSSAQAPYGFPLAPERWAVIAIGTADRTTTSTSFASLTDKLLVPSGAWRLSLAATIQLVQSSASGRTAYITLSSDASTETNPRTTCVVGYSVGTQLDYMRASLFRETTLDISALTTMTVLGKVSSGSATLNLEGSTMQPTYIRAVCAYL